MFFEYALEPSALDSWDKVRYFLDAFGPWKGRFLAKYPRTWKRMVLETIPSGYVERTKVEEKLRRLDDRIFTSREGWRFDTGQSWHSNASAEHARLPFRAIIKAGVPASPIELNAAHVDEDDALWRVSPGAMVPRQPIAIATALHLLLRVSRSVVLIDPYFQADKFQKRDALIAICEKLRGRRVRVEIHFSERNDGPTRNHLMREAQTQLPGRILATQNLSLMCWRERAGGARLHNRYILTEVGGVQFGDGIEQGDAVHEDRLSLLGEPERLLLWSQYCGAHPSFDAVGASESIQGTRTD